MKKIVNIFLLIASLLSATSMVAQKATDKETEAKPAVDTDKVKDYTKGFNSFIQMGLPDVTKARYVNLRVTGNHNLVGSYNQMSYDVSNQGNAWLLKEDKAGKSVFVINGCQLIDVYDAKVLQEIRKKERSKDKTKAETGNESISYLYDPDDTRFSGSWKDVDLKTDIKTVFDALSKREQNKDEWNRQLMDRTAGRLFLFSIHIFRKGYKDDANKLVERVFALSKQRRKVIMIALNQLANGQYISYYGRFINDSDWKKFHEQLQALTETFKKGWLNKEAVKKLASLVQYRIDNPTPPAIKGKDITEAQQQIAKKLADIDSISGGDNQESIVSRSPYLTDLWILETVKPSANQTVIQTIKAEGMKAVPLLIALLGDQYLTGLDFNQLSGRYSNVFDLFDKPDLNQLFNNLQRPATRGDIARNFLEKIVFVPEDSSNSFRDMNVDECRELCRNWYEECKDLNRKQLTSRYMKDGSRGQKEDAIQLLLSSTDNSPIPELEAYFLENAGGPDETTVRRYIVRCGPGARDFANKYIETIKQRFNESIDNAKQMYEKEDDRKEAIESLKSQQENSIRILKQLASSETAKDILDNVLTGKVQWTEATKSIILQKLASKSDDDAMGIALDAAVKCNNLELKMKLIDFLGRVPDRKNAFSGYSLSEGFGLASRSSGEKMNPDKNKELWLKLLNDNQYWLVDETTSPYYLSVAQASAVCYELLYSEVVRKLTILSMFNKLGDIAGRYWVNRAKAQLSGKKPVPVPFPDKKQDLAEVKKVADKLLKVDQGNLKEAIDQLPIAEQLILNNVFNEKTDLNKALARKANTIQTVKCINQTSELDKDLVALKGKELTETVVRNLCDKIRSIGQKADRPIFCIINRQPLAEGVVIVLKSPATAKDSKKQVAMKRLSGSFNSYSGKSLNVVWDVADGKNSKKKQEIDPDFAEFADELDEEMEDEANAEQQLFWQEIKTSLQPDSNACINIRITFQLSFVD